MNSSIQGSCLCGAVRYAITGPIGLAYQCHCSLCRKQGGSASNFGTIVEAARFNWLQGKTAVTEYRRATGFSSFFCRRCGAPVPNALRALPYQWIPLGGLETTARPALGIHLHTRSRACWDAETLAGHLDPDMPTLEGLLRLLNGLHR